MDESIALTRQPSECKLPKATLASMIKEMLPTDLRCSAGARELVVECAMEFLQLLSSEAAETCNKEKKSKIVTSHVEGALRSLKFEQYVPDVLETEAEYKESQAKRPKLTSRLDKGGISAEELQRQQEALFAKSRVAYQVSLSRTTSEVALSRNASEIALSRNVSEATLQPATVPSTTSEQVINSSQPAASGKQAGGVLLIKPALLSESAAPSLMQSEVAIALRGNEEGSDDDYDNL